jgi:hypothetical protein
MFLCSNQLKGILSTSCVIFSYPKLLSISVLTFIKWRLTPSYAAKDTIFWQKRPKTIVIVIIVRMTIFKSIHMIFYVNTSWACALFINNKQHVGRERSTRGRKRTLTDSEIKRNRSEVSSKWNKCRIYVGDQLDRCRWMERTQGSATRQISRWSGKDFAWLLLIGKPTMLPSFLNRFSYFMNLWWCLWSFSVDIIQYM